jgi:hypothetical protein
MKKIILAAIVIPMIANDTTAQKLVYPTSKKVDVTDDYHGTKVSDPYRWLENDTTAETGAWVKAQNKVTFDYLDQIPYRNTFRASAYRRALEGSRVVLEVWTTLQSAERCLGSNVSPLVNGNTMSMYQKE